MMRIICGGEVFEVDQEIWCGELFAHEPHQWENRTRKMVSKDRFVVLFCRGRYTGAQIPIWVTDFEE